MQSLFILLSVYIGSLAKKEEEISINKDKKQKQKQIKHTTTKTTIKENNSNFINTMQLATPCDESGALLRKRSSFLTLNTSNVVSVSYITSLLLIPPSVLARSHKTLTV